MKTDSYLQTQREARKIRDDYRYKVDPILQRNSKNVQYLMLINNLIGKATSTQRNNKLFYSVAEWRRKSQ